MTLRGPNGGPVEPGPLRRDRDFLLFWSGQAVSLTGSAITRVALPLVAVVTLAATPLQVGFVTACVWLPFLGLPLLAGVYVDRHLKRPILITTNAVRVFVLALVPLLWALDALTVPALCAAALASGVAEVVFQIAELAYVPVLVGRDRLMGAYSGIEVARHSADLGGPGLAGILVQAFGPPLAILADALSYLVSTVTLAAIRRREPPAVPAGERNVRREIGAGLRFTWRVWPLRTLVSQLLLVNLAWQAFFVAFVLYGVRDRQVPPGVWGVILAASGAAAIFSAVLAPRLGNRMGHGPALVVLGILTSGPMLIVPAVAGPLWMLAAAWTLALGLTGLGGGAFNVLATTLRVAYTPDHLLGRVGGAARQLVFAGIPFGGIGGGVLVTAFGSRTALWVAAGIGAASLGLLVPLWRLRSLPEQPAAERTEPLAERTEPVAADRSVAAGR